MKWIKRIVLVLLVLIVIAVVAVALNLGHIIKTGVEAMGPKFTGAPVTLEKVHVSLLKGQAGLKDLVVGNPAGYKTPSAFELGEVRVKLDPKSIMSDTIVIQDILIDAPKITFEKSLKKSNIAQLLDNIEAAGGESAEEAEAPAEEQAAPAEESEGGKKVVIEHVLVKGARIKLSTALLMGKAISIPLPPVELKDIGKDKPEGTSFPEALAEILQAVLRSVTKAVSSAGGLALDGAKAAGDAALKTADVAVEGAGAVVGVAAGGAKAGVETAGKTVKVVGEGAAKTIKGAGDVADKTVGAAGDAAKASGKVLAEGAGKVLKGVGGLFGKDKAEKK